MGRSGGGTLTDWWASVIRLRFLLSLRHGTFFLFSFLFFSFSCVVPCSSGKCETPLSLVSFLLFSPFGSFPITLAHLARPVLASTGRQSVRYANIYSLYGVLTALSSFSFSLPLSHPFSRFLCSPSFPVALLPTRCAPILSFFSAAPSLACHIPCGIRSRSDRPEYYSSNSKEKSAQTYHTHTSNERPGSD